MQRCIKCVLPEIFPGVHFDKNGICAFCIQYKGSQNLEEKRSKYRGKSEKLIEEFRGKSSYDGLMSYSGGKDSTYVLSLLREEYGLNILAVTFDNGFLPKRTYQNIQNVIEKLNVDHMTLKPRFDLLKKIFAGSSRKNIFSSKSLSRASSICTACMSLVKFSSLRLAIEKSIPFIFFGWSPGQIPLASSVLKNNAQTVMAMQRAVYDPIHELVGDAIKPYFLEEQHFQASDRFPYNISPLAFLDYDEKRILKRVSNLKWKAPKGVDAHSTNCLLNTFANYTHKEMYGYHPYVFELAKLVREGHLERLSAIQKLNQTEDIKTVESIRKRLDL
jgi:hypothetical protein